MNNESYYQSSPVIELSEQSRGTFIARTYAHLFGAVMAFILIEVVLFKSGLAEVMAQAMGQRYRGSTLAGTTDSSCAAAAGEA